MDTAVTAKVQYSYGQLQLVRGITALDPLRRSVTAA